MVRNARTTLANDTVSDFDMTEDVAAAYAFANIRAGAVSITPGIRYEHTKLTVAGFRLTDGTNVSPVNGESSYDNWLPSLILRIKPTQDTVFRLAYSRSLGRPQYEDLSPGSTLSTEDDAVSLGNPNLKPYVANALDASAEWYFAQGGLLSFAVFAKFIKNPIFTSTYILTNTSFAGQHFDRMTFTQPLNADKGDIIGLEAAFQQQFTFLPGLLSGLGVNLNLTLTDGSIRVQDGRSTKFPNQSDIIYGAQIFYQKGPIQANVAFHNTGKALLAMGDIPLNDQYSDDYRRLDAKISYQVTVNIQVFAQGQNLTDEPTRQYQAGIRNWTIQNERYGRSYYGGVSVRF
jgi:TonB-dependent receptor